MTYEAVGNSGVAQARFAIIGLLVLLAGKNRDVIEFLPLFGGFFTYQISTFVQVARPYEKVNLVELSGPGK
ncbi:hypothetical protein M885DRAFT_504640 [Pelagophyceae sp. CCMP2097]|nr:hypothetical protein M885DRAFT_504640 [Pelagophyceae sp. CCMP2097]